MKSTYACMPYRAIHFSDERKDVVHTQSVLKAIANLLKLYTSSM